MPRRQSDPTRPRGWFQEVVYFIQETQGAIKIGITVNLAQRYRDLALANAHPLYVLGVHVPMPCRAIDREGELHHKFRQAHIHGEWFHPHENLLAYIGSDTTPITDYYAARISPAMLAALQKSTPALFVPSPWGRHEPDASAPAALTILPPAVRNSIIPRTFRPAFQAWRDVNSGARLMQIQECAALCGLPVHQTVELLDDLGVHVRHVTKATKLIHVETLAAALDKGRA